MEGSRRRVTTVAAIAGILAVAAILVLGTIWMGRSASRDTERAVRSVSLLYLDELAGRREQVVASNLQESISNMQVAIGLMTDDDLSDMEHLQAYQARMKQLYKLEKFAFVDADGLIYTSLGTQDNIADYRFDYKTIAGPEISILNLASPNKKVVIALPVDIAFEAQRFVACFMEIDMKVMLEGVSMQSSGDDATFCTIYTREGVPLSGMVLVGATQENNLLDAMRHAQIEEGYSYEGFRESFTRGQRGETSFVYGGVRETLSYVPVDGTDWVLTYLIRESVISEKIGSITNDTIRRSIIQSALTVAVLVAMFGFIIAQNRRNARMLIAHEKDEAAARARHEELEHRLELQEELTRQAEAKARQDEMITALASDYRSVYYLQLDQDRGICYQSRSDLDGFKEGDTFPYLASVTAYANRYIVDQYRDEFLRFIQPDSIREGLKTRRVIGYRYLISVDGHESYEMVRFAGVRHPEDRDDGVVRSVGACFVDVDAETREGMAKNQALSDALEVAERANKAKTAFLSSMSHEIRTPMNAIIGLDNIVLTDPETTEKTKDYLRKIAGSAEHLLGLINDILDMSRIESGRMMFKNEEFSFPKLLEAINTMFSGQCADRNQDYQCHIRGHIDDYYIGDNMKLRQVLINILGNAVKFTPEGGRVELTVERVARFEGKSTLRFTIADTGIGMSKEFLPHLFDTFSQEDSSTTSKYGSSGLGMAITKNIVEMMNGNIEVESEKGKGTTFVVTVTLADSDRRDEGDADEVHPADMSVLIIDDDPVACEHAKLVLEKVGIAAETVQSGAQAVEMVRLRHARRDPYNLILVDWQMPEMDGVEVTRRIRSIVGNESAIIILTAYRWDDVLVEATEAGVDSFIPKPLFATTVIEEFREAIRRKGVVSRQGEHKADLTGRRILLAEDMQVNAEIIMMVLEMRQMQSELAVNGRIAVEMFSEHEPGYYDAILMDMRMPEMDGLEATRTIRALDRADALEIPIIALTANAFDEDVQRSLQAGLNAHLTKPVEPDALFETLESLIRD